MTTTLLQPDPTRAVKRGTYTTGSPNTVFVDGGGFTYMQRVIVLLPFTTKQWRLKVANQNANDGTNTNQPATIDTVWVGTPAYATRAGWVGNCTGALTQALSATTITLGASGADQTSAWVTSPTLQFKAHQPLVVSMAITIPIGGTGTIQSDCLAYTGIGINAAVGNAVPGVSAGPWVYDIRVEYDADVPNGTPVGLFVTASDGSYSPDGALLPSQTWPTMSGILGEKLVINAALGATGTANWTNSALRPWTRFDLTTYPPDYGVVGPGLPSNDITGMTGGDTATSAQITTTLTGIQDNIATILANFATANIKRTYICTVPPRNYSGGGSFENARLQFNAWARTQPLGVENCLDIDFALRNPTNFLIIDPLLVASDDFHFSLAGQFRVGREVRVPNTGVSP